MRAMRYEIVLFFSFDTRMGGHVDFTTGNVAYRISTMCGTEGYKILTEWARFQLCRDFCCQDVKDLLMLEFCQSRFGLTKSAARKFGGSSGALFNHKPSYFLCFCFAHSKNEKYTILTACNEPWRQHVVIIIKKNSHCCFRGPVGCFFIVVYFKLHFCYKLHKEFRDVG